MLKNAEEWDITEKVGTLLTNNDNKYMNSNFLKITKEDVKGALVSAGLMALTAMLIYVQELGSIWAIDLKDLVNAGILAGIVCLVSIFKNLFTTADGKFLGMVKWK